MVRNVVQNASIYKYQHPVSIRKKKLKRVFDMGRIA
jgi:hypothetical protein